jgi:capsular polysaccharide export protein
MLSPKQVGWARFTGKRILLLQGPHGPFFKRVASALLAVGACAVEKINFNGGDLFYYPNSAVAYRGDADAWPNFLNDFIEQNKIDCIFVFGDCRPMHVQARKVALEKSVQYWVFEEGYVRPHFITFEQHGVNGNSFLPTERDQYDAWLPKPLADEVPVPASFAQAAKCAVLYFICASLAWPWFWRYKHHRKLTMLEGPYWWRGYARRLYYRWKEKSFLDDLNPASQGKYFLAVLQVATDAQVAVHSPFGSIEEFVVDTVRSFALHASLDAVLLVKHHPLDRGYTDYTKIIADLTDQYKLGGRLRYIHDQHLPTLLSFAEGVITINSTVGLQALFHGTPVITMGDAVYDMDGLTCQAGLDNFWRQPQAHRPDSELHAKFRNYVIFHTQINGNFYVALPDSDAAGLRWRTALTAPIAPPLSV